MTRTILIVALCLLGIFIHPFDPGLLDFFYRFIIFTVIVYLIYNFYRSPKKDDWTEIGPSPSTNKSQDDIQPAITADWQIDELIQNDTRTKEFLIDQFNIVSSMVFPDMGWIFYKRNDYIYTIHQKNFNDLPQPVVQDRYQITGLMHILDEKNDIVIENNLDKTKNLLPFYADSDYSAASFLGLTMDFDNGQKAFVFFDSHHQEHFNQEDRMLFSRVAINASTWILNRVKAYALLSDLKQVDKLLTFAKSLNSCKTISQAIDKFAILISEEFEASRLTVSLQKQQSQTAVIKKMIGQKDEFDENFEFPLDEGLTGWVISKNKPYLIEDLEKGDYSESSRALHRG